MGSKKNTLLIDQDDVLAEYIEGVIDAYNIKYNTTFSYQDCVTWDLYGVFGKRVDTVMHEPDLFRNLKPVKYALEVFERLFNTEMFEMYIVTAANPSCVEAKSEWLKKYMPYFPQDRFIVCQRKYMIKGDFLLDDGLHNIEDFAKNGGTPIIFNRPHNISIQKPYLRVNNWLEFEKVIMEMCICKTEDNNMEKTVI